MRSLDEQGAEAMEAVLRELDTKREEFISAMARAVLGDVDVVPDEMRQYAAGFLFILEARARGEREPQQEFIATMLPALKSTGMQLKELVPGAAQFGMGIVSVASPETHSWWITHVSEHLSMVLERWESA
ncbi:MAG: hypothetical protein JNK05_07045 [Myxococcales bacterium]|nr:hypothetical protein [Myxococcales bacterium]